MGKGTFRLFRCTGGIHVLAGGPSCFPGMGGGPPGPGEELFAGRPSWTQQKNSEGGAWAKDYSYKIEKKLSFVLKRRKIALNSNIFS